MDFFDKEAELSDREDDDDAPDDDFRHEKKRKKVTRNIDSSEEEEDDDEDLLREEMKDLINDEPEEPEESDEEVTGRKRKRDEDLEEDLEEDDYDLLEENLGRRIERKKKFRRVRRLEDDDDEDDDQRNQRKETRDYDDREAIANELFDNDDDNVNQQSVHRRIDRSDREAIDDRFAELSGSEGSAESDEDDFIVDDDDRPIAPRMRKKKSHRYTDEALQQAQDIFGVEYDFDEVNRYEDQDYVEDEEIDYEDESGVNESQRSEGNKRANRKRRSARKSIFEIYEPSELERSHLTQFDNDVRNTDLPERFQIRSVPVTNCDDNERREESEWILDNAFGFPTISIQDMEHGDMTHNPIAGLKNRATAGDPTMDALKFIRNESLEVPTIAYYKKEYVEPELNINDLWVIYKWDEKWCQLQMRKQNMIKLFMNIQTYQNEYQLKDIMTRDLPIPPAFRLITQLDIERISQIVSFEELRDCFCHFQLYYSYDVQSMKQEHLKRERERRLEEYRGTEEDAERILNEEEEQINAQLSSMKLAQRKDTYTICKEAGIVALAKRFGLTPEQFGENLRDNYQRHEVEQDRTEPSEAAQEYVCHRFPTAKDVLKAAKFIVAKQLSCDPLVRKCVREQYFARALVNACPTKKGAKEIDENHPCYTYKYLINKPAKDFVGDQFLQLIIAKKEGLMNVEIGVDPKDLPNSGKTQNDGYLTELCQLYYKDEFSDIVKAWNTLRAKALRKALDRFLFPFFEKELINKLLSEAHAAIIKQCGKKLYNWLKVAPYAVTDPAMEEDEDFDTREGIRIMGFSFVPSNDDASFAAVIDNDGEVSDFLKLEYFMLKRSEWSTEQEKNFREKDKEKLKRFILNKKPHVIAVGADTIVTRYVIEDIKTIITELIETEQFPNIPVELVDNDLATVYMNSKRAITEFNNYPPHLRRAISLARRLLDPLIEFSQLCTADEEILCLSYHQLQMHLPKDELLDTIYHEFVNRVNEVGVDLNRAMVHPHTAQLVQFVGGLGPRKGAYLMRYLKKQQTPLLENRTQLVQNCGIGKTVFINCAGFIKIDTASLSDTGTDTYIEVLDSTRVHPEAYDWARKMAVDALEYDEDNDTNPAQALEEIIENPEKLKDLDLDAFAEELELNQQQGKKRITLYDIRAELTNRYKDLRTPYRSPLIEEIFHMLTRETHQTFYIGKLVMGQVIGITRRKPQSEQLDQANPIRNDETGLWKCPFCFKDDFPELSEVWNHFDEQRCPGQAIGVKVRLDNGVIGLIPTKNISDKEVVDPADRVKPGMTVHCRITKIFIEKFLVDLTCRTSDLIDSNHQWRPPKDRFYYYDREDSDQKVEDDRKKKQNRQTYIKRIIVHPSFHNIDFRQAEKMMMNMDQGEAIIRPSSKANDHLTLTWKVFSGINQHVDIREEGKDNAFSLGHQLFINNETYEDLDEIIARYVQPMASYSRDIISYKYFKDITKKEEIEKLLREEKQKAPSRIPYFLTPSKEFPGKFLLSYQPNQKPFHELVTVTPDGLKYRNITHRSLSSLFKWFKLHFNDRSTFPRTPVATPVNRTPQSTFIGANSTPNIDPQALQRAAAAMPNHVFNQLSQVAGQTPSFGGAAAAFGNAHTNMPPPFPPTRNFGQYTPAQPTPMQAMTPHLNTPRNYPPSTPGSMPPPHGMPSQRPGSRSGTDWSSMAESWGKKPKPRTPLYNTPGASSQMSISPNANTPNVRGDQTPLVDEWSE